MATRTSPNATTPVLNGMLLERPTAPPIRAGSDAWFAWLAEATRFYVCDATHGNFFCRKERRQRGGQYWSAYRRHRGRLYHVYIGKDADVTPERLVEVGARLAEAIQDYARTTTINQQRIGPPEIARVRTDDTMLWFDLTDGRIIGAPLAWFPRLEGATPQQRAHWTLVAAGTGAHWPDVDEHISARVLMNLPS